MKKFVLLLIGLFSLSSCGGCLGGQYEGWANSRVSTSDATLVNLQVFCVEYSLETACTKWETAKFPKYYFSYIKQSTSDNKNLRRNEWPDPVAAGSNLSFKCFPCEPWLKPAKSSVYEPNIDRKLHPNLVLTDRYISAGRLSIASDNYQRDMLANVVDTNIPTHMKLSTGASDYDGMDRYDDEGDYPSPRVIYVTRSDYPIKRIKCNNRRNNYHCSLRVYLPRHYNDIDYIISFDIKSPHYLLSPESEGRLTLWSEADGHMKLPENADEVYEQVVWEIANDLCQHLEGCDLETFKEGLLLE